MRYSLTLSCTNNAQSITSAVLAEIIASEISERFNLINLGCVRLADYKINYCTGCSCCFNYGYCPLDQTDDMHSLRALFMKADLITLVVPVYAYNVPGIMKSLIDRLIFWNHILRLTGKKITVLTLTHNSGSKYVCNYVSNIFSLMGAHLMHYSTLEIIPEHNSENHIDNLMKRKALDFAKKVDLNVYLNEAQINNHFLGLKSSIVDAIKAGRQSFETQYWEESGLLDCSSFSEWESKLL